MGHFARNCRKKKRGPKTETTDTGAFVATCTDKENGGTQPVRKSPEDGAMDMLRSRGIEEVWITDSGAHHFSAGLVQ